MIRVLTLLACFLWAADALSDTGSHATPIADVTVTTSATLIRARDSMRFALSCTNNGPEEVRWGNAGVTATTGQAIPSGSSIEIQTTAAVYMITGASSSTVSCTEETR